MKVPAQSLANVAVRLALQDVGQASDEIRFLLYRLAILDAAMQRLSDLQQGSLVRPTA